MKFEPLKIDWSCQCESPHNCVVLEDGEQVDVLEISEFAGDNAAFCPDWDEAGDDTVFVKSGDVQQGLELDDLYALVQERSRC